MTREHEKHKHFLVVAQFELCASLECGGLTPLWSRAERAELTVKAARRIYRINKMWFNTL